jgi:hypothetical protein
VSNIAAQGLSNEKLYLSKGINSTLSRGQPLPIKSMTRPGTSAMNTN